MATDHRLPTSGHTAAMSGWNDLGIRDLTRPHRSGTISPVPTAEMDR